MTNINCIQYPGNMTQQIIDFCGRENIISENRDGIPVAGFFLHNRNISEHRMFITRWFIVKEHSGNLYISPRHPDFYTG